MLARSMPMESSPPSADDARACDEADAADERVRYAAVLHACASDTLVRAAAALARRSGAHYELTGKRRSERVCENFDKATALLGAHRVARGRARLWHV